MLIIEQIISPHSHSHSHSDLPLHNVSNKDSSTVEFDAELGEIEREEGAASASTPDRTTRSGYSQVNTGGNADDVSNTSARSQAIPLTLGLVIHSLADGLALGVSFFPTSKTTDSSLSAIVFLAIIIHKRVYTFATNHQVLTQCYVYL
jgi:solute carrier family 39 (zinc transporter), member 9